MKKLLRSLVDIRSGEWSLTLLMISNLYLILVAYYFLKPARDALFLTRLGAEQLPYVFILTAFLIVPITTIYARASKNLRLDRLFSITTLVVIICLVGLRWMMTLEFFWVPYAFYIWVSIYGALMTSQFWLLANAVFDSAQSKRIFALLGLAAILGAWTGGEVTSLAVSSFGISTENLLMVCVGLMVISIGLTNLAWRAALVRSPELGSRSTVAAKTKDSLAQLFGTIRRSTHLMLIVGIISVTMMVAALVDFQFKAIAVETFPEKSDMTAFLGLFYGRLSAVSFLLQLVLTYRFLRIVGVGGAILFLPIGLVIGSVAMLAIPGLLAGVMLRGSDGALKYSIDKTGRELLFLPVSLEVKKRTKVFIDMFVDRWARGFAGGVLLLLIPLFGFESDPMGAVTKISIVVIGLLMIWIVMALKMRREYVNTFRMALMKRQIDPGEIRANLEDQATLKTLLPLLSSGNQRQTIYALDLFAGVRSEIVIDPVRPMVLHESPEIRFRAIRVLTEAEAQLSAKELQRCLSDSDERVRTEAVRLALTLKTNPKSRRERLTELLMNKDSQIRAAALSYLIQYGQIGDTDLLHSDQMEECLARTGSECTLELVVMARALGHLDRSLAEKYLPKLMQSDEGEVVRAAIEAVGRQKLREFVPTLVQMLGESKYRASARAALVSYGESVLGTLADYLIDPAVDRIVRENCCSILARIPSQRAVMILTRSLREVEPSLKVFLVQGLNRLRRDFADLKFDRGGVTETLIGETENYYHLGQIISRTNGDDLPAAKLLSKVLIERQDENVERIFRLLGLVYRPADIYNAYQGTISSSRRRRASAIEFLDNLIPSDLKKYLLPLLDEVSPDYTFSVARELFGIEYQSEEAALEYLINGRDSWLKACAIYRAGEIDSAKLLEKIRALPRQENLIVQETIDLVLRVGGDQKTIL